MYFKITMEILSWCAHKHIYIWIACSNYSFPFCSIVIALCRGLRYDPFLQWNTLWDAAAEAGRSRLYGGIHIQDGDLRGREMGQSVASLVIERTHELF